MTTSCISPNLWKHIKGLEALARFTGWFHAQLMSLTVFQHPLGFH
jgi:hypothetical protein